MLPRLSVARAARRTFPGDFGVQDSDHKRHAYGSCSRPSSAVFQLFPSSAVSSTFAMSGAPEKATPRIVAADPTRARTGAAVMFDLTKSSVIGRISSGLNVTPGSPGFAGYR